MGDTNEASNASVETEDEEELLVASTNTVTQEETVMIQNVNTLPTTILYNTKIVNDASIPAVGTMMRPHWNMKITTQTFFIPKINGIKTLQAKIVILCRHHLLLSLIFLFLSINISVVVISGVPGVIVGVNVAGVVVNADRNNGLVQEELNPVDQQL